MQLESTAKPEAILADRLNGASRRTAVTVVSVTELRGIRQRRMATIVAALRHSRRHASRRDMYEHRLFEAAGERYREQ
jgi:hypothetical protein